MMAYKLTDQQVVEICVKREAGAKLGELAKAYGVTESAIYWRCLRNGAERPEGPSQRPKPRSTVRRNGHAVNMYTPEEDALILALTSQDYGPAAVARVLTKRWPDRPRKPHSIVGRLATLARWEEAALRD